ncbi:carbohydrate ABC transporter substrate-binding protein [Lacticaseibacillus saniviri]
MKKRLIFTVLATMSVGLILAACGSSKGSSNSSNDKTLKVAALEGGYGADVWKKVAKDFESANPGVKVQLTIDKKLESVISPQMKANDYPDVVHLATGRPDGLTETMIKGKNMEDLSSVMNMKIPGESQTVKDVLRPGFDGTLATEPYGDGKTYMMPMFYAPTGLFYNKTLLKDNGWTVPKTWDEMLALGQKAKAKNISLFTYPTTGYMDSLSYALLADIGGKDYFNKAMAYDHDAWAGTDGTKYFDSVGQLLKQTANTTVANANNENYKKNQQLILDNKALFMPNGTWVVDEMKDAPRAKGFEWGFAALPGVKANDQYAYTYFEQIWVPKAAKNKALAKKFVAFMYSDKAAKDFLKGGAVQPIKTIDSQLTKEQKGFYDVYNNGAKVLVGGFKNAKAVEGVNWTDTLFGEMTSVTNNTKSVKSWQTDVVKAADKLR